jgi:glycosyltransferase involved in cell wall biosynthesis
MLEKKFKVPSNKIRVIHNGIDTSIKCIKRNPVHNKPFCIGFIGRLDTPKGVHVLINAMHYLVENNIVLVVAGSGALEEALKSQAKPLENTSFIGRIEDPYVFLSTVDLLVVPSIREPLGNVCLEAGLCKVPVLAANIDGIPEIIENHVSGELIDPTDDITMDFPFNAVPLPEFVVDPVTYEIHTPLQINPKKLADKILELSLEEADVLSGYAEILHEKVVSYFNIDRYTHDLHKVYQMIDNET